MASVSGPLVILDGKSTFFNRRFRCFDLLFLLVGGTIHIPFADSHVHLFPNHNEHDQNVDCTIEAHQIQEVPGKVVPNHRAFHIVGIDEQELD